MGQFDFIDVSTKAYMYVWEQRVQLISVSLFVLGIKILSFAGVLLMGLESNALRQGLMLIPAHFVEGVVICQILVMAVYDKSHDMLAQSKMLAARPILAGAIVYLLIKLALSFVIGMTFPDGVAQEPVPPPEDPGASMAMFFLAFGSMALVFWAFRLFWMYIPLALGFSILHYMNCFKSFFASFTMIGTSLLCSVPVALMILFFESIIQGLFPEIEGQTNFANDFASAAIHGVGDYLIVLLASLALAFGFYDVLSGAPKPSDDS